MPSEEDEIKAVVEWYEAIPDDFKRYVAFRYERMKDESFAVLYETFASAQRLVKAWKRSRHA